MQNFGKIKNNINSLLVEGIIKKDDKQKKTFKNYIKLIKENKTLKTQFLVFSNIENKIESDKFKANEFVKENIEFLKSFDSKTIFECNEMLIKSIGNLENLDTD